MSADSAILIIFATCAALIAYVYFGYPLLLWLNALGRPIQFQRGDIYPSISIIVPAHNEESTIRAKLDNLMDADYPRELVEILIGSDGSSDRTEDIVRPFVSEGVGLISFPQQHGKSAIQNGLVAMASGEILVFTDADCLLPRAALRTLVENFADPRVGLVTARPRYANCHETSITENEGLYLRYETWLRDQESRRGLLAMASGSLFAIRRSLWQPLDNRLSDDFVLPLRLARAGIRNVIDTRVVPATHLSQDGPRSMLRMKMRIIHKDFRALLAHRDLLNPLAYGPIAVSLWSHKLLRWLVPYFLLALLASNFCLLDHLPDRSLFRIFFILQMALYALALAGLAGGNRFSNFPWSAPASFVLVNLAALLGTLKYFAGRTSGQWKPERNVSAPVAIPATASSRVSK